MIVLSDMMGTLTTGSPVLGLVDWVRHNQSKTQASLYMLSMMPGYFFAKRGWIDWQTWGMDLMIDSLSMIKSATPKKIDQVSEWIVETDLWRKRRDDVLARLIDHRKSGAEVYIASSVFEPAVIAFAKRIDAKAIGTPVKIVNGRVSLASALVANEKKIEAALRRLGVDKVDYAYGDTSLDIPLLEHADHPVAVYPDAKLRAVARERGWVILGDTPSYP